jgi:hypothetical protein
MDLYIVSLNGEAKTYTKVKDIPFQISEETLANLYKNCRTSIFIEEGELHITFSKNNEDIYKEVYANPKPLNEDDSIKILHYNKNGKLNSPSNDIPSVIDTLKNKKSYHKNGKTKNPVIKETFKDDYGEYTLLNNISKELKEVRCYIDGFRQYIKNNGDIEWILNQKLHSPSDDIPDKIRYYNNSISSESYHIKGQRHRKNGPAIIGYHNDGSIYSKSYYINGLPHREDGPAVIKYYDNGFLRSELYCIDGKIHKEDGPAFIKYSNDGSIQSEQYYINDEEQNPNN